MTPTTTPKQGFPFRSLFYLLFTAAAYFVSWHHLVTLDHWPALWPALGGLVWFAVLVLLPDNFWGGAAGLAVTLFLVLALPDRVTDDAFTLPAAIIVVLVTLAIVAILFEMNGDTPDTLLADDRDGEDGGDRGMPSPRRIIGLSGYAGAGKDTAALGLLADGWARIAVSDRIYELALIVNPMIPFYVRGNDRPLYARLEEFVADMGWTKAKDNTEVRRFLQDLGNGVRDVINEDAWVEATMSHLPDADLVFTSVRFPNEAQAIKDAGGHIVRVQRPLVEAASDHPTEVAMDDWPFDAYVNNDMDAAAAGDRLRGVVDRLYPPESATDPATGPDQKPPGGRRRGGGRPWSRPRAA